MENKLFRYFRYGINEEEVHLIIAKDIDHAREIVINNQDNLRTTSYPFEFNFGDLDEIETSIGMYEMSYVDF